MNISHTATVTELEAIDGSHHNGDAYWDGDQTLWKATIVEAGQPHDLQIVVPRGNAFIGPEIVRRHIEALIQRCDLEESVIPQLLSRSPRARPRQQITLPIDPPG